MFFPNFVAVVVVDDDAMGTHCWCYVFIVYFLLFLMNLIFASFWSALSINMISCYLPQQILLVRMEEMKTSANASFQIPSENPCFRQWIICILYLDWRTNFPLPTVATHTLHLAIRYQQQRQHQQQQHLNYKFFIFTSAKC